VDALGRTGVTSVVPGGFAAYARVLHPLPDGERWADVAPAFLGPGAEPYEYPLAEQLVAVEGSLDEGAVDALAAVLAPASPPGPCHFGLWDGWGWEHPGAVGLYVVSVDGGPGDARATAEWRRRWAEQMRRVWSFVDACPRSADAGVGRSMLLFDGPLAAVAAIGHDAFGDGDLSRQSPQWWWPADRSWFVATEIDVPWTYVAGPQALVDTVLALPGVDAVPVSPSARW
jgi:hypothetical protein